MSILASPVSNTQERILRLYVVILAAIVLLGTSWSVSASEVSAVRFGVHPDKTRLVIELDADLPYRIFTLSSPYRVVVDLPEVEWKVATPQRDIDMGVVTNYRFGLFQAGNSRLVVDVARPVALVNHLVLPPTSTHPYRFVIDLKAISVEEFAAGERKVVTRNWTDQPDPSAVARERVRSATPRGGWDSAKRLVVIDPGHGGPDPGAIGTTGVLEKEITLKAAQTVKRVLEASGRYEVLLTRDRDVFVPLRERYATAERADAEMFISLHADSNGDRNLRGGSIYTLSERASDREAAALAAKENRSDAIAGINLSNQSDAVASFLIELRQRQTMNESAVFSDILLRHLQAQKDFRLLRNSHRFAGFAVLKSPDVPSILFELGYLSNRQDERLLTDSKFLEGTAMTILRAADEYFERKDRLSRS